MSPGRLPPQLLALTPGVVGGGDLRAADELIQRVRAAVAGGLTGLLVREPGLPDAELLALACSLRERFASLWIGLHDRAHLAGAARAQGVHLGGRSLSVTELGPWLPDDLTVGLSTHAVDDEAAWVGADYLFHGPIYDTPKPHPVEPIGLPGLAAAVARTRAPIWALGGLAPEHLAGVLAGGARGVAVLGGILPTPDPEAAAARYTAALSPR